MVVVAVSDGDTTQSKYPECNMLTTPSLFLEEALAWADRNDIDYDICYPQIDCIMSSILPLFRGRRIVGYIKRNNAGEFFFELIGQKQTRRSIRRAA
jgi:hypothetical protein